MFICTILECSAKINMYSKHRRSTDSVNYFSGSLLTVRNSKPRARGMGTAGNRIYSTIRTTFSPSTMVVLARTNESPYRPRSRMSYVPSRPGCCVEMLRCANWLYIFCDLSKIRHYLLLNSIIITLECRSHPAGSYMHST